MPRLIPAPGRSSPRISAGIGVAAAMLIALWSTLVLADALDGVLQVSSAYVNFDNGVIQLYARVQYPLNPAIRKALQDGVTLTFDLEAKVDRVRHMWFDSNIVDLTLQRELAYHVVTDQFVVRDVRSGDE
jgi:hypothetical protein